ncbi:hypothetical protein TCAL_12491 [Tigriopus californicus]|uniref:Lipocalin/cytosolic fatty-acid binding domain-containing protein n=1 Tax=Tigriopus californicus TaxID=6832 RepID=A0A553PBD5_TIGCA|nr:hypothetical protein TCAL_12491 [Tigriopus californicus]|eukprot:TCALIF_12491-PA protein Name:"Protein of unknown function" AED:0.12 eAED:0.12 QI:43/0.66/0.75/1/1/1/4/27/167
MDRFFAIFLVLQCTSWPLVFGAECRHPPPSPDFTNEGYAGRWYEIGKIQTLGGSLFQLGSVCTIATYSPYDPMSGGGDIGYSSSFQEPNGTFVNATGFLVEQEAPGHFVQTLEFFGVEGPSVDYNVIWLDEDSAIEYDCNPNVGMDLNPNDIEYKAGSHEGCWEGFE